MFSQLSCQIGVCGDEHTELLKVVPEPHVACSTNQGRQVFIVGSFNNDFNRRSALKRLVE